MTVQPPGPVADRRAPERRSYERGAEDRAELIRVAASAAMALCGGLAVLFVFFWALGAIDVKNAIAATVVAVVFAGVWLVGLLYRRRSLDLDVEAQRTAKHDRERRGF